MRRGGPDPNARTVAFRAVAGQPDPTPADQCDYFSLLLADVTGLRRAKLVAATTGALSREALDDAWTLQVRGQRPARAAGADARAADTGNRRLAAGVAKARARCRPRQLILHSSAITKRADH